MECSYLQSFIDNGMNKYFVFKYLFVKANLVLTKQYVKATLLLFVKSLIIFPILRIYS